MKNYPIYSAEHLHCCKRVDVLAELKKMFPGQRPTTWLLEIGEKGTNLKVQLGNEQ